MVKMPPAQTTKLKAELNEVPSLHSGAKERGRGRGRERKGRERLQQRLIWNSDWLIVMPRERSHAEKRAFLC